MINVTMKIEDEWGDGGWIEGEEGEYSHKKWFKINFLSWFLRLFVYFKSFTDIDNDQTFRSRQRTCNRSMKE